MKGTPIRILLTILAGCLLWIPLIANAATESRTALVIGNSAYTSGPLQNPVNDAADMAAMLKKLGFNVTLKQNARLQEMDESIREFGRQLKRTRGVGLFFYAGHGMQIGGVNYLLPVNAKIEKETDIRFQSINADMVLAEMENAENGLNLVLLDACRDNPYSRSFRNAARGLAIVSNAPVGTFISYSTGANQVARDGDGRNSPYTKALLENIAKPVLSINSVFMNVRNKVRRETGQVPWELTSLGSDFYFVPQSSRVNSQPDDLVQQRAALERERQELERQKLAMGPRSQATGSSETHRDGRFIAYDDGTVLDTKTNLMWAAKDNGSDINWANAKSYCENYRGGGYSNWRMPTQDELAGLYDAGKSRPGACNISYPIHVATELIDITCLTPWASETRGSEAAFFDFNGGGRHWTPQSRDNGIRALPVRFGK